MNPLLLLKGLDLARIGLWALTIICVVSTIWLHGYFKGSAKLDRYKAEQAQEATKIAQARTKVTERVVTRYLEKKGATERVTEFIEREVKTYADANPSNMCIDPLWLRLHDYAATHASPKPPAVPDRALRTTGADSWHPYSLASVGYGHAELRPAPPVR